jgi:predicted RNase H-like HicB family nuclease
LQACRKGHRQSLLLLPDLRCPTKTMQFPITLYQDEDGWHVVECPIIPGCMSQGETEAEALRNIQEAIQLCLEVRREQGLPLTIEGRQVEVPVYA